MAVGGVVINFVAKTASAAADIKVLGKSLNDMGSQAQASGGKVSGWTKSLAVGIPIAGAVIGAAAQLADGLIEAGKAAWEDKQQADKLARTLGTIPGVTQKMIDANSDWIDSMELATLVSDTDLRVAVSKLALATGDLDEAQKLVALSADVAAGSGKSFATVTDAMAKAAAGNTAQLQRMFPWLDKNKDGTVSLTEAQTGLGKAFKGAAGEAAKNDPWKRLGVIFGQLKEAIGTALLPILEDLSDWFSSKKNQQKVQDFLDKVTALATKVGVDLVDALKDLITWLKKPENVAKIEKWTQSMADFATAIGSAANALGPLLSALEKLKKLTDLLPSNLILRAIGVMPNASAAGAPSAASMGAATTASATAMPAPPTVIVTEEQVYRAVQRLLLRGDARNGRLAMVR